MSTDFSIKPVGTPVATPIVHPASDAAQNAVQTDLPAGQSVTAADASVRVTIDPGLLQASVTNQVIIDREAASVVYQEVDSHTNQVVKQFPEEAVLRRRAYFHALDLSKEAPPRRVATDRRA
jgi:hypothetical protein